MKKRLFYILLLCDTIPIICMVVFAIIRRDMSNSIFFIITALLMFIWHNTENYLKKKYTQLHDKKYVTYLESYPHVSFSVVVVISSVDFFFNSYSSFLYRAHVPFRIIGILLVVLGISIRLYFTNTQNRIFSQRERIIKPGVYKCSGYTAAYGFFMISLGVSLGFASVWAVLITCTLVLFSLYPVCRQEDQLIKNKII